MASLSDDSLWAYAIKEGYTIISKDSDFHQKSFLFGAPPKVIWIKKGNCSTQELENVVRKNLEIIRKFSSDNDATFLVIS